LLNVLVLLELEQCCSALEFIAGSYCHAAVKFWIGT